jgi:hypothetical protein
VVANLKLKGTSCAILYLFEFWGLKIVVFTVDFNLALWFEKGTGRMINIPLKTVQLEFFLRI